jgi:hypothetical protein
MDMILTPGGGWMDGPITMDDFKTAGHFRLPFDLATRQGLSQFSKTRWGHLRASEAQVL